MQLEFQYIFNLGIMAIGGIAMYLFGKSQDHEKRIQKVEDIQGTKLDRLTTDFEKFQLDINLKLTKISEEIHKKNGTDNAIDKTMNAVLKHLEKEYEAKQKKTQPN